CDGNRLDCSQGYRRTDRPRIGLVISSSRCLPLTSLRINLTSPPGVLLLDDLEIYALAMLSSRRRLRITRWLSFAYEGSAVFESAAPCFSGYEQGPIRLSSSLITTGRQRKS